MKFDNFSNNHLKRTRERAIPPSMRPKPNTSHFDFETNSCAFRILITSFK